MWILMNYYRMAIRRLLKASLYTCLATERMKDVSRADFDIPEGIRRNVRGSGNEYR